VNDGDDEEMDEDENEVEDEAREDNPANLFDEVSL
jgi:hypothetical protein